MKKHLTCFLLLSIIVAADLQAQETVDWQAVSNIRNEGLQNSQVMETMFYLTDVNGPRLTNSPNQLAAAKWCVDKLQEWGLQNANLEPWGDFGKGWQVDKFSAEMVAPQYTNLVAFPKAWTPGTDSLISGVPVLVDISSEDDFGKYRGKLQGEIVMTVSDQEIAPHFEADATRRSDEDLEEVSTAPEPGVTSEREARRAEYRRLRDLRRKISSFYYKEGVALVLEPSRRDYGTILVQGGAEYADGSVPTVPQLVVAIEQYNRMVRLLQHDMPVEVKVDIKTSFFDEDTKAYNVVAEIPGADKKLKNELVMLGGHLDSWHSGTGATDNAAGCAVAMEAVRILQTLGLQPRRTVRIVLWSGEEQGLLGSKAYVKKHFGDRETMALTPEHERVSGYFNLDNGSGKIRGVYLQENEAVRPIFEAWLEPFHDLGAATLTSRNTGGTDHLSFDAVGLPGFQFIQDPIDYGTRTHHTNMDVYDHALPGDLMQASVIMASFVYHTAMRDKKLPRKMLPQPAKPATNGVGTN